MSLLLPVKYARIFDVALSLLFLCFLMNFIGEPNIQKEGDTETKICSGQ